MKENGIAGSVIGIIVVVILIVAGISAYMVTRPSEEEEEGVLHAEDMKYGLATSFSGSFAFVGKNQAEVIEAIQGKLEELRGRTFSLYTADTMVDPTEAIVAFEKLDGEGIYAMTGFLSPTVRVGLPLVQEAHLPTMMNCGTSWFDTRGGKYAFRGGFVSDTVAVTEMALLAKEDYYEDIVTDTAAFISLDEASAKDTTIVYRIALELLGVEIVGEEYVPPDMPSYKAVLSKLIGEKPDLLGIVADCKDGWTMHKNAREMGYEGWISFPTGNQYSLYYKDLATERQYLENCIVFGSETYGTPEEPLNDLENMLGHEREIMQGVQYDSISVHLLALEHAKVPKDASLMEIREAIADNIRAVTNPPGEKVYTFEEGLKALEEGKEIDLCLIWGDRNYNETGEFTALFKMMKWDFDEDYWSPFYVPPNDVVESLMDEVIEAEKEFFD